MISGILMGNAKNDSKIGGLFHIGRRVSSNISII
jgi:hypothetical protein